MSGMRSEVERNVDLAGTLAMFFVTLAALIALMLTVCYPPPVFSL
jgi:hypothetical protein